MLSAKMRELPKDFTIPRHTEWLGKVHHCPVQLKDDYKDEFSWNRGGIMKIPYKSGFPYIRPISDANVVIKKDASSPSLARDTSRTALRLPLVGDQKMGATLQKSASATFLQTGTFRGRFVITNEGKKSQATDDKGKPMDPRKITNTKMLWRASSAADCYWKYGVDPEAIQVPGMTEAATSPGGIMVDWANPEYNGMTLFLRAAFKNNEALIRMLPVMKCNVNAVDWAGKNCMHHIAEQGSVHCLTYLTRKVLTTAQLLALLMQKDDNGNTPLHLAAMANQTVVAKFFLKLKPEQLVKQKNNKNLIPYQIAFSKGAEQLYEPLNPLSYVTDSNSLVARVMAVMGKGGADEEEDEEDEEEEEPEEPEDDDEDGGAGGGGSAKLAVANLDRDCNWNRCDELRKIAAAAKGKKKGKKGKKGKKKK